MVGMSDCYQEYRVSGCGEDCFTLNNQRPMIESHLGHHSDTDLESLAVAEEQRYEMDWPRCGNDAGHLLKDHRPAAEADDNLSRLLDRRQQLEVLAAIVCNNLYCTDNSIACVFV